MAEYDSPHGSDWSTASAAGHHLRASTSSSQLARTSDLKPELSHLRQEILTEDEYTAGLSDVIQRTFFPQLREFQARDALVRAVQSEDPDRIEESVRRMREVITPTPRRRNRGATPGRTPFGTEPSDTPTYFSETPSRFSTSHPSTSSPPDGLRYDPTLSLDAFQAKYTSEDNASFADLLAKDNASRKEKYSWAWEAERKANAKAVRGREARERLVDLTRQMVEADPDGVVRLIEGAPGRPGERKLVVNPGALGGLGSQRMVEGSTSGSQLLITDGGEGGIVAEKDKGKGKADGEYIDYEKPTAEEEEENRGPKDSEIEVPMEGFQFTNRNSLMFAPDANGTVEQLHPAAGGPDHDGVVLGEPKAIRYHATRLAEVERKPSASSSSAASNPSPTRSRINAAITGTPYPAAESATPKVRGFSFVDALPTPRASTIDSKSLQELMTWGTIEATPRALSRSALSEGGGPFRLEDTSRREMLAHKMAQKAKRSLADREAGHSSSLRRSVLESTRGKRSTVAEGTGAPGSPRMGADLSPAARSLLRKTGKMGTGLGDTPGWKEGDRERTKARAKAREIESQDRLKRARWTPSPAPSTGFTP